MTNAWCPPGTAKVGFTSDPPTVVLGVRKNDIKVLLDGDHLQVTAWVDRKGLKRLKRILAAHALLLEQDEEDVRDEDGAETTSIMTQSSAAGAAG